MATTFTQAEEAQLTQTIEMFEVITQTQPHDYQSLEILKEAYSNERHHALLPTRCDRPKHDCRLPVSHCDWICPQEDCLLQMHGKFGSHVVVLKNVAKTVLFVKQSG